MRYRISADGIDVIGYNTPISFYDDSDVLQQQIYLEEDDTLNIGDVGTSSGSSSGGTGGAPTEAQYVVLSTHDSLSNERVLAVGDGLDKTDGGANGNVTLTVDVTDVLGSGLTESSNNIDLDWGTPTIGTIEPDDSAAAGSSTNPARSDHQHAIACAAASSVDLAANAEGSASSFARSDHHHQIDQSITPTWTDSHTFGATMTARTIQPQATDTYDLGTTSRLWRKAYISELEALVLAENTISLVGGWLIVPHDQGTLPADLSDSADTCDFGKAMSPGDFVEMRSIGQVEYFEVGTLVSGTTYRIGNSSSGARNLDGTGANSWPAGTPFNVLGALGDGRITMNSSDPAISLLVQGVTYNANIEYVRIGNLNGSFGVSSDYWGLAVGSYSEGNYLLYNDGDGFAIHAGGGAVVIDDGGITITEGSDSANSIEWRDDSDDLTAFLYSYTPDVDSALTITTSNPGASDAQVALELRVEGDEDAYAVLYCPSLAVSGDFLGLYIGETFTTPSAFLQVEEDAYIERHLAVGDYGPASTIVGYFREDTVDTTETYYGTYTRVVKTAGATDGDDDLIASYIYARMDDTDSTIGELRGISGGVNLDAGTVTSAHSAVLVCQLDAGTVSGDASGLYLLMDQNGGTVGDDFFGIKVFMDADGTVTGDAVMLELFAASNVDRAIQFRGSGTAHGMTDLVDTDVYGEILTSGGTDVGGLQIIGYRDDGGSAQGALVLRGRLGEAADTTHTSSGKGVIQLVAQVKSSATAGDVGSNGNLVTIQNGTTTRALWDAEGSAWAGVEWTTFDEHDDVRLLDTLEATLLAWQDPVKASFGEWLEDGRAELERLGIVHFDDKKPGSAMVNTTRLSMLLVGAIRQLYQRMEATA